MRHGRAIWALVGACVAALSACWVTGAEIEEKVADDALDSAADTGSDPEDR